MSEPQRLPRKYLAQLQQAKEDLRLLGLQAQRANERLRSSHCTAHVIQDMFREIESGAFRIALELSELKLTEDCSGCPAAPPTMPAQMHLLLLAEELERQATLARHCARQVLRPEESGEEWHSESTHVFAATHFECNGKK